MFLSNATQSNRWYASQNNRACHVHHLHHSGCTHAQVSQHFLLDGATQALAASEAGHARGKIVLDIYSGPARTTTPGVAATAAATTTGGSPLFKERTLEAAPVAETETETAAAAAAAAVAELEAAGPTQTTVTTVTEEIGLTPKQAERPLDGETRISTAQQGS